MLRTHLFPLAVINLVSCVDRACLLVFFSNLLRFAWDNMICGALFIYYARLLFLDFTQTFMFLRVRLLGVNVLPFCQFCHFVSHTMLFALTLVVFRSR